MMLPTPFPIPVEGGARAPVFRFAPSPNGLLHRGHARSALLNAELARRWHGRFLLRIEDIDPERSRPEHCAAIAEDLRWLGLDWEAPPRFQSRHGADYLDTLSRLHELGVVYPCFCTRAQLAARVAQADMRGAAWPRDPDGAPLYDGVCRDLSENDRAARLAGGAEPQWRLAMAKALALTGPVRWHAFDPRTGRIDTRDATPERWGDPVIARKRIGTSYHLAVTVDDALQGVTHVVRGTDLEAATDVHAVLQALLGLPQPLYWHHPLIVDAEGRKLSKSKGSLSLRAERAQGLAPAALWADALGLIDH